MKKNKKQSFQTEAGNPDLVTKIFSKFGWLIDAIMGNKFVLMLISFVLASSLVLYMLDNPNAFSVNTSYSKELQDIEVEVLYDDNAYVVDISENGNKIKEEDFRVSVIFTGSRTDVIRVINNENFKLLLDAESLGIGSHKNVEIKVDGVDSNVKVTITPQSVDVDVFKVDSKEVELLEEAVNKSDLAANLSLDSITLSQQKVLITGADARVEQVDYVKALVDMSKVVIEGETVVDEMRYVAYDSSGNSVDVVVESKDITATVLTSAASFTVPVKIVFEGTLPDGKAIGAYTSSVTEVTIYGDSAKLATVNEIVAKVNLSSLTESNSTTVDLIMPAGVTSMSQTQTKVEVVKETAETKVIENVSVEKINLASGLKAEAINAENRVTSVKVTGAPSLLASIESTDFVAVADLSNITQPGEYQVEITIKTYDSRFNVVLIKTKITIVVTEV